MSTRATEIKEEMETRARLITRALGLAESAEDPETAQLWRDYAASLERRNRQLQNYLEREEAPLVRPEPARVDCDGWSV